MQFRYMIAQKPVDSSNSMVIRKNQPNRLHRGLRNPGPSSDTKDTSFNVLVPQNTIKTTQPPRPDSRFSAQSHRVVISLAAALFTAAPNLFGAEESVRLTPGIWEIRTATRVPALSQSISRQFNKCIAISEFDPSSIVDYGDQCLVTDRSITGDALKWLLVCDITGRSKLYGHGEFTSQGDRAEGKTTFRVPHQGRQVEMVATWSGRRIGDCE
jgi:Protein of unknown function (DUF3617)